MKFGIPVANGKLCKHFGHCENFSIIETEENKIISENLVAPPSNHEPGVFPQFLAQHNVNVVISGGIGQKAIAIFNENNIKVFTGVNADSPAELVLNYLKNQLEDGTNLCNE